jgi:hypothetical protein
VRKQKTAAFQEDGGHGWRQAFASISMKMKNRPSIRSLRL